MTLEEIEDIGYRTGYDMLDKQILDLKELNREQLEAFWRGYDEGWDTAVADEAFKWGE